MSVFKDFPGLENVEKIQGLSRTNPVFGYFQGLGFREKNSRTFKDSQGCTGTPKSI